MPARAGIPVVLWCAGGGDYAWRRAHQTGIAELIAAAHAKEERDAEGHWRLPVLPPEHRPAVLVDDQPHEVPPVGEIIAVLPYIGPNPWDAGLSALLQRVRSRGRYGGRRLGMTPGHLDPQDGGRGTWRSS